MKHLDGSLRRKVTRRRAGTELKEEGRT